jgi:transcriptional regulator with XRE-family HTH domain
MNKELARTIGTAARAARKALQLTQEDAAERIDVSVEFYARIERGISLPSILTFARIVSSLGVSADLLLGGQELAAVPTGTSFAPAPPDDSQEIRRLVRRLRKAQPGTLRLVSLILEEIESPPQDMLASALDSDLDSERDSERDSVAGEDGQSPVSPMAMVLSHEPLFHGMRPLSSERPAIPAGPVAIALAE